MTIVVHRWNLFLKKFLWALLITFLLSSLLYHCSDVTLKNKTRMEAGNKIVSPSKHSLMHRINGEFPYSLETYLKLCHRIQYSWKFEDLFSSQILMFACFKVASNTLQSLLMVRSTRCRRTCKYTRTVTHTHVRMTQFQTTNKATK